MTPATKKHQQLILLEPDQAALLDELAAETNIAKQVLLRDAVADLLSKHHKGVMTLNYIRIRAALKEARQQLAIYYRDLGQRKVGVVPMQACLRAMDRVDVARASIGDDVARSPLLRSGLKKMVAVYRFKVWNHEIGDNQWAPRMATLETIKRIKGVPDLSTETLLSEADLDGQGYYPQKSR